jgi:hypothetical protein
VGNNSEKSELIPHVVVTVRVMTKAARR